MPYTLKLGKPTYDVTQDAWPVVRLESGQSSLTNQQRKAVRALAELLCQNGGLVVVTVEDPKPATLLDCASFARTA